MLAAFALPLLLFAPRRSLDGPARAFALTVLLALLVNAAIAGALSNPNPRYQSRIVWLAPFVLAVAVLSGRRAAQPPRAG